MAVVRTLPHHQLHHFEKEDPRLLLVVVPCRVEIQVRTNSAIPQKKLGRVVISLARLLHQPLPDGIKVSLKQLPEPGLYIIRLRRSVTFFCAFAKLRSSHNISPSGK
jgi:hypothetical protein